MDTVNLRHEGAVSKGALSARLYGSPIRPRKRDRYGELTEDAAIHGQESPPLPRTARIDRIRGLSPVERTAAEAAYVEAYELATDYAGHHAELCQGIHDAAHDLRGRR